MADQPYGSARNVYNKFVTKEDDLEGALAYSFYVADLYHQSSRTGAAGSNAALENHFVGPQMISGLKEKANTALSIYTAKSASSAEKQAKDAIIQEIKRLEDSLRQLIRARTNFWIAVAAGVVAALLISFALGLAIFLNKNEQNPLGGIYKLLREGTEAATSAASAASTRK